MTDEKHRENKRGDEDFEIASQVALQEGEKCFIKQVNS